MVAKVVKLLDGKLRGKFCSPLREDKQPSVGIFKHQVTEEWLFKDFATGEVYYLGAVYAYVRYGKPRKLGNAERMLWMVRLLMGAGILKRPLVKLPLCPAGCTSTERKYYEGFEFLLECRQCISEWRGNPVTFSQNFAAAWSGISSPNAIKAFAEMKAAGIFAEVGTVPCAFGKRTALLMPGDAVTKRGDKTKEKSKEKPIGRDCPHRKAVEEAALCLKTDYEGFPLRHQEIISAISAYSGVSQVIIRKYHADIIQSLARRRVQR